jgi:hypothetical protein
MAYSGGPDPPDPHDDDTSSDVALGLKALESLLGQGPGRSGAAKLTYSAIGKRKMNDVHDMGGMHGMGPLVPKPDEFAFHHP